MKDTEVVQIKKSHHKPSLSTSLSTSDEHVSIKCAMSKHVSYCRLIEAIQVHYKNIFFFFFFFFFFFVVDAQAKVFLIMKTCPCKVYPLKPHFKVVKLGFAGVYLFFLFLLQNIDCGYSLEPPR